MGLRDRFTDAMKEAMKTKQVKRLGTIRMILAAVQERSIAARVDALPEDEILGLLGKMIKQREESAATYESGGRPELAAGEREEITVIREFMPRQLSPDQTRGAVAEAIAWRPAPPRSRTWARLWPR
jgi:uncharacterized protein YqeY